MLFIEMLTSCKSFRVRPSVVLHRGVIREFKPPSLLRQASSYKHIQKCYEVLGIDEDSSMKEVKAAFVELARRYHPDSGCETANAAKFDEIKGAYESVRDHLSSESTPGYDDVNEILEKDFGIKHTVPQHRQYLSYEGVGHGSPTQRWHQYQQHRLQQAVERVHDYRVARQDTTKEVVLKDATLARQYKTTQAIERLVEDLIQESMARGEFNNLPGSGKPLKFAPENPYVDSTTRKLNEVLITNGYVPEWVMLEREIGDEKRRLRSKLADRRSLLGPAPLAADEQRMWDEAVRSFGSAAAQINRKIDKFNMLVPLLNKQQLHLSLASESEKILNSAAPRDTPSPKTPQVQQSRDDEGFLSFIFSAITRW